MGAYRLLVIIMCFALSLPVLAGASHYNFPGTLHFNDQIWKLDAQRESPKSILAEYVINDESATHWTQLFSYQQMLNPLPDGVTPRDFADRVEESFKGKDLQYTFKLLSSSDDEAMIEYKVTDPVRLQQDEIQRIIKTKNGILVLIHYVIKRPDMDAALRKTWINNLQKMPVIII